jgi:hypothetical protein
LPNSLKLPRALLDECLPRRLKREFVECVVSTVPEMGGAGKKNGELMRVAHDQFDVFVTADQNLQYHQNLAYTDVGVIVLVAINNRIETLAPLMPQGHEALKSIVAGQVIEIEAKTN